MCYVVDLTDRNRPQLAERATPEIHARHEVINRIARELNNPLAALTFYGGAPIQTVGAAVRASPQMLADAEQMMSRISALTLAVLVASRGEH